MVESIKKGNTEDVMKKIESSEARRCASRSDRRKSGGLSTPAKVLIILLAVLIVAAAGLGIYMVSYTKGLMKDPSGAFDTGNKDSDIGVDDEGNLTGKCNILFLGIDSNSEREGEHRGWHSDVMMLCTVDFDKDTIELLSVPRDMWVTVPKEMDENGNVTKSVSQRINTAYNFGGGPDGRGALFAKKAFEDFINMDGKFNVKIDYYMSIDMDGIYKLADDLGGVEVVMDRDVKGVGKKGETVTITTDNIDPYLRTRKGAGDDFGRVSRQQDYILAVAKKLKGMDAVSAASRLYGTMSKYTKTDLSLDQCVALAGFVKNKLDLDSMSKYTVPSKGFTTDGGAAVLAPVEDEFEQYMREHF